MAKSENTAAAKAKADVQKIEVLVVKSIAAGFRRIGIAFTREAQHLDASVLTAEQKAALVNDPNLAVTRVTVPVAAPGTPANPVVTPVVEAAPAESADAGTGEAK